MNNVKLDPKCFYGHFAMAITNTGYLLPCCYCDENDIEYNSDPGFNKLVFASKIDDHETVEDIVFSKEWKDFEENLRNHKGPTGCIRNCKEINGARRDNRHDVWVDKGITLR